MTPLKPIKIIVYAIACCCFILLRCADNIVDGGTETGNAFGVIYNPNGSRAVNAKVYFVPVNYNPITGPGVSSIDSTITNDTGAFEVDSLPQGYYNILGSGDSGVSFNDSVLIQGDTTNENISDTLRDAGSLSGVVRLQPGDDSRTILILVFGTQTWTAPIDSVGNFTIANMAEGTYHVRILSTLDDYGVLDTNLSIQAGTVDTVIDTIYLPFTGIPVPQGLSLAYDTLKQIVTLTWDACDTNLVKGYNTYRKHSDSDFVKINTALITDTTYSDSSAIQDQNYEYKITAVDKDDNEGKKSNETSVSTKGIFTVVDSVVKGCSITDGEFGYGKIRMDNIGNFYLADQRHYRMQKLDSNGAFLFKFQLSVDLANLDVEIDQTGAIYVSHKTKKKVYRLDSTGNVLDTINTVEEPLSLLYKSSILYVSSHQGIEVYDTNDIMVNKIDYVFDDAFMDVDLCADSSGNIFIANGHELYVYDISSNSISIVATFIEGQNKRIDLLNEKTLIIKAYNYTPNFLSTIYIKNKNTGEHISMWNSIEDIRDVFVYDINRAACLTATGKILFIELNTLLP